MRLVSPALPSTSPRASALQPGSVTEPTPIPRSRLLPRRGPHFDVRGDVLLVAGIEDQRQADFFVETVWERFPEIREVRFHRRDDTLIRTELRG